MRFIAWLIAIISSFAVIVGTSWFFITHPEPSPSSSPLTFQPQSQQTAESFDLIVVQTSETSRRVLQCHTRSSCQSQVVPSSVDHDPVFDGESWYHYIHRTEETKATPRLVLERLWPPGKSPETIVEETPLVRPRGLLMSPDGSRVAYWLDNISDPKTKLTELWVYDSQRGSTTIIAEKLSRDTIVTPLHWNRAGTLVWFFNADHQLQTVLVDKANPYIPPLTIPASIDPDKIVSGQIDVNNTGQSVAYVTVEEKSVVRQPVSQLTVIAHDVPEQSLRITGTIPHLEWIRDGSLVYAVEDTLGTSFWRWHDNKHTFTARHDQSMVTAHSDLDQQYLLFATDDSESSRRLHALDFKLGRVHSLGRVVGKSEGMHIVRARHEPAPEESAQAAGTTATFSDGELVGFVQKNITAILEKPEAKANRILMTDHNNTLFVDYDSSGSRGRILLTVRDIVHTEWSIRGRYEEVGWEWRRAEGSGVTEPKVTRWYEWENALQQWVLKSG